MKILLFTHKSDIDGMGAAVLAKLAFQQVDYILCETFNLQEEIHKFYDNKRIYDYDFIYITDMWLEDPMISIIAEDVKLANKVFVFDHHKSSLVEEGIKYNFTMIKIDNENGLCSGTSLFYEYLISTGSLDIADIGIQEFSELTRKYDTWEWKTKYNDEKSHELSLLFDAVGCETYIEMMYQKLTVDKNEAFQFNQLEKMLIKNKKRSVMLKLKFYSDRIHSQQILGWKAGIVFIDYEYRNDLSQYLREQKCDYDFVMMISMDHGTISYRSINDSINVRLIAEHFNGKGHDKAASSPISNEQKEAIRNLLVEKS